MKRVFSLLSLLMLLSISVSAQLPEAPTVPNYHYQLSSHILDIVQGKPVPDVKVSLEKQMNDGKGWVVIDEKTTDKDGRITDFLRVEDGKEDTNNGVYRLTFYTKPYFESQSVSTFYPFVEVVFEIEGDTHYHVPITLSPYGYSTYRGS